MNSRNQSFLVYFLLIVAIAAMFYMGFRQETTGEDVLTINQVAYDIQTGEVSRIIVESDDKLQVIYANGTEKPSQQNSADNNDHGQDKSLIYGPACQECCKCYERVKLKKQRNFVTLHIPEIGDDDKKNKEKEKED